MWMEKEIDAVNLQNSNVFRKICIRISTRKSSLFGFKLKKKLVTRIYPCWIFFLQKMLNAEFNNIKFTVEQEFSFLDRSLFYINNR